MNPITYEYFDVKVYFVIVHRALTNYALQSSKNYIGMVLRNNMLYGVYKLNGVEYEMETGYITTSSSEPAQFDRVDLNR